MLYHLYCRPGFLCEADFPIWKSTFLPEEPIERLTFNTSGFKVADPFLKRNKCYSTGERIFRLFEEENHRLLGEMGNPTRRNHYHRNYKFLPNCNAHL